jgi:recombination protein RecR
MEHYPSLLLEKAVDEFYKLPGVGRKTALKMVLSMLRRDKESVDNFAKAITQLRNEINYCHICHNISETETCEICADKRRDHSVICIVENIRDVMSIEKTQQFHGVYHVLGGIISPADGISYGDLEIKSLIDRVHAGGIKEIIFALSPTMEGDTTNFYIYKKLADMEVKFSILSRGIAVGNDLEYIDEVTLGRSIQWRTDYKVNPDN